MTRPSRGAPGGALFVPVFVLVPAEFVTAWASRASACASCVHIFVPPHGASVLCLASLVIAVLTSRGCPRLWDAPL